SWLSPRLTESPGPLYLTAEPGEATTARRPRSIPSLRSCHQSTPRLLVGRGSDLPGGYTAPRRLYAAAWQSISHSRATISYSRTCHRLQFASHQRCLANAQRALGPYSDCQRTAF